MTKDKDKIKKYLNIARGPLDGLITLTYAERSCLDVSDQLSATRSLLKKTNNLILKNHIDNCVREGILAGDESKVDEIIKALEKQVWQQEEKQQDPSMLVVFK